MSGLSNDDPTNENECASIGSGERTDQSSPKGRDFCSWVIDTAVLEP